MTATDFGIQVFDPHAATPAEWEALTAFKNTLQAERFPDDPPRSLEFRMGQLRNLPPMFGTRLWGAWASDHTVLLGSAFMVIPNTEDNRHLAQFEIEVLPQWRGSGLGRALLALIAAEAAGAGRTLMMSTSSAAVPAGSAFLSRIGATVGLTGHTNQLDLADLDHDLLRRWQGAAPERAPGFRLGLWEGAYPEDELPAIVDLMAVTNDEPLGDLEVEAFQFTAE
ncbi:MAG TPA: GNAT family N-acetyltransferase, partial [Chloroflexia bacterium]|nr:GNAT family N-acetyltransferase [Chloroflexia bacterium]